MEREPRTPGRLIARASVAPIMLARRGTGPAVPAEPPAGAWPKRDALPAARTCADCAHILPRDTCAQPVAAGLLTEHEGFGIVWPPEGYGAACVAFESKAPAAADSRPYRLAQAEADAAHAEPWDDGACARFQARTAALQRRGFAEQDAEDLAERLHLRDVHADYRHLCLECRHLAGAVSTGWRCGDHKAADVGRELPRDLVTMAQDCAGFAPRGTP